MKRKYKISTGKETIEREYNYIPAYPIYRRITRKTKAELTPEILRLSEEIMKS